MTLSRRAFAAASLTVPLAAAAGCSRRGVDADQAATSRGPIRIWVSTNAQELAWGKAVADAWNDEHPEEPVTVQSVPAGASSEEAISAAIVAGTTADLVFNAAPAALPDWVRMGGLVDLTSFEGGREHIEQRAGGDRARLYAEDDGRGGYFQLPWKSNPVMIMFNKELFTTAGLDPESPGMDTLDAFLDGARQIVASGASSSAIWPPPTSDFFESWSTFYSMYLAQTGGTLLVEDGACTFDSPEGLAVFALWRALYDEELAPRERFTDDPMAAGTTAMQLAGPWAIPLYRDQIDYGVMPVPTIDGIPAQETITFADAKNVAMFSSSRNRLTAWDFLVFATGEEWDGKFLELTGQMPLRADLLSTYPEFFREKPEYRIFAEQADRVADVPYLSGGIEIWQRFRDEYSASVIFAKKSIEEGIHDAAEQINALVKE